MDARIADLLTQSRASHARYRRLSADTQNRDLLAMGEAIRAALLLRLDAHVLDPDHADPAWLADAHAMKGQLHEALLRFYGRYLAPAEAGVA